MLHRALLFIVAAHAHGALGVELPLLEASGAATGRIVIAGKFSPGSDGALVQDAGGLSAPVLLLGGPTPHVVETHQASSGKPIAGTAAVGIVPSVSSSMEALCLIQQVGSGATLSCAAFSPPTKALELVTNGAVGVCSLGTNSLVVLSTPTPACPAVKPFKFVSADAQGNLRVTRETDLGVTAKPGYAWRAVGAGQLSGNTVFAAVRSSADDTALEVFAFSASDASAPTQLASAALTASVPLPVIGVSVADIYADGAPHVLITYADSTTDVLWLTEGAEALYRAASTRLDPVGPSARWLSIAAGSWLSSSSASLPGESQLLGLRAAAATTAPGASHPSFHVSMLLFGRPEHWLRRRASISGVRAMQEFKSSFKDNGPNVANLTAPLDNQLMQKIITSVHANTYSYPVCDCKWSEELWSCSELYGYEQFVRFLDATKDFKVDGQQLRVWLGLSPPSEAIPTGCKPPPDSPLTPFNETQLWQGSNYTNYTNWGDLAGRLAALYPHFVAVDIDDFSSNVVTGAFDGNYVAKITSNMRARSPHLALSSVLYSNFTSFPDLALMLDAPVFFFRNAIEGAQTCEPAACPWGPHARSHSGSCLAGICSEPTTFNAPLEIAQVVAGLPPSRSVITGYYATGHSSSGQPTARYVSRLLQTLAVQDRVAGVMTYCAKAALQPCTHAPLYGDNTNATLQHSLGCIVRRAYGAMVYGSAD
jgi:hypothetical protein